MKKYVQVSHDMCAETEDEQYPKKVICEACFNAVKSKPELDFIDADGQPDPETECEFKLESL